MSADREGKGQCVILYGSSMSPYVRKVIAFASEKGIELDSRPVRIGNQDPEFRRASPFGKMPALVDGDFHLPDSSAIIHYLEAKHPEPPLIPGDPQLRGKCVWLEEFADTILAGCGAKMFFNRMSLRYSSIVPATSWRRRRRSGRNCPRCSITSRASRRMGRDFS